MGGSSKIYPLVARIAAQFIRVNAHATNGDILGGESEKDWG